MFFHLFVLSSISFTKSYGFSDTSVLLLQLGFVVILLLHCVWLFATPWTAAHQASLSFIISQNLLKFLSIESVMHSTVSSSSSPSPPALNLSQNQGLFQWADSLNQVAKVLEL